MKNTLYIIGGGLAGISQAIKYQKDYQSVCIIEGSQSLGGLLKSICINGKHYPIGAHFLRKTNTIDIDKILFPDTTDKYTTLRYSLVRCALLHHTTLHNVIHMFARRRLVS